MIEIPLDRLSPELLTGIIEEFIQREGTDYGASEVTVDDKIQQVKKQIQRGDVVITFDHHTESCNLLTRADFKNCQLLEQQQEQQQGSAEQKANNSKAPNNELSD